MSLELIKKSSKTPSLQWAFPIIFDDYSKVKLENLFYMHSAISQFYWYTLPSTTQPKFIYSIIQRHQHSITKQSDIKLKQKFSIFLSLLIINFFNQTPNHVNFESVINLYRNLKSSSKAIGQLFHSDVWCWYCRIWPSASST
jgi:hypothetical protein